MKVEVRCQRRCDNPGFGDGDRSLETQEDKERGSPLETPERARLGFIAQEVSIHTSDLQNCKKG
jgi:hypothetical protein